MHVSSSLPVAVRRRTGTGLSYLVASGLLWGTGGLTGSLLGRVAGLPALSVAAFRLTLGGALIVAYLTATRRRGPKGRAALTRIAAIGLLAALFQGCYFTAVRLTSVPLATLVAIGSAPVIVQAIGRLAGPGPGPGPGGPAGRSVGPGPGTGTGTGHGGPAGRSVGRGGSTGRRTASTTCLALAGLVLLVGLPSGPGAVRTLAGTGLAVLAAAGFAAVTLIGTRPVPGLDDLAVTGFGFVLGGLALLPAAALAGGLSFRPSLEAFGLLIALGTGPTAVAYTLYFRGLRTAAATTAALLALLEPLTAAVLAALLLGQRLTLTGLAGALLLAAAVARTLRAPTP